jgi:prepilin peptidase CpaA
MTSPTLLTQILLLACASLAIAGAIADILSRKIPNWLCALLLACSGTYAFASGGFADLGSGGVHAFLVLLIGMILFRAGLVGGGDAKFYTACALALPLSSALPMLGWTSFGGLFLLLVMAAGRRLVGGKTPSTSMKGAMVPYGVAIAIGFLMTAASTQTYAYN